MSRQYPARPIASVAAVILDGEKVLLVRRGQPPRQGIWTFPGGAMELGETAREACAREALEETGLTINVGPAIDAVDVMEADGDRWRFHYAIMDFAAEVAENSGPLEAADDAADALWASLDALGPYKLAPAAQSVLARALWLRANGWGPTGR